MQGKIEVRGGREVMRELLAVGAEVEAGIESATHGRGRELQRQVKLNASTGVHGPREPHIPGTGPGPNIVTGDYVESIDLAEARIGGVLGVTVFTNAAQAERLEYGFVGADSRGYVYNQQAYPHWEPAIAEQEALFFAQVEGILRKARL